MAKGNLDELIRWYMDLKTKNLGDYMNRSLTNKACEELVPMLQEVFTELWEPLLMVLNINHKPST